MAIRRIDIETGSEVVIRESDGKTCALVWVVGDTGRVFAFDVLVAGEGEGE